MAGFFLDSVLECVLRIFARALLKLKTAHWRRRRAIVVGVELRPRASFGCPLVKIRYRPEQETSERSVRIPFLLLGDAEDYAHSVHPGDSISVRVKSRKPSRTAFFPADQR